MANPRAKVRASAPLTRSTAWCTDGMRIAAGGFGLCGIPENLIAASSRPA